MQNLAGKIYQIIKNSREVKVALPDNNAMACDFAFGLELASYSFDSILRQSRNHFIQSWSGLFLPE